MSNNVKIALLGALLVVCIGLSALYSLATGVISFGVNETKNFGQQQQPDAKSLGEFIGKQYSQLRALSVTLDDFACRLQVNEAAQADLYSRFGKDENSWSELHQQEAANLRLEHTTLLMQYSRVAAQYNNLRTDSRTIADKLGLNVDKIPQAHDMSPDAGMCKAFALPEQPPMK